MSEVPPVRFLVLPVLIGSLIGGVAGAFYSIETHSMGTISGGVILGAVVTGLWVFSLLKIFYPEKFYSYASETESGMQGPNIDGVQEMAVPIVLSEGETRWLECELTPDEWRAMCEAVHAAKNFSLDVLRTRFTDTNARNVYAKVTGPLSMEDVAILIKDGKGYAVTQGRGEYFFERMATLPFPYPIKPDVLKMVDSNRHTQHTHI